MLNRGYINKTNANEVKHDYLFSIFRSFMFLACIVPQKVANKNMIFYTIFLYDHSSNFYDSCNLKTQTFYSTLNFWLTCIDFLLEYCFCHNICFVCIQYFFHFNACIEFQNLQKGCKVKISIEINHLHGAYKIIHQRLRKQSQNKFAK